VLEICHRVGVAAPDNVYTSCSPPRTVSSSSADPSKATWSWAVVLLRAAGTSLHDVISCLVYARQSSSETKPVRTTVRGDLVADRRVEVTAIVYRFW
jgi:hypothetical protein